MLLTTSVSHPAVQPNNIWPNPTFEAGDGLDLPTGTPTGWNRGGNNSVLCEVSMAAAVSPTHSLMVNDTDEAGYAEWYSDLPLAGLAALGDHEQFSIVVTRGEFMTGLSPAEKPKLQKVTIMGDRSPKSVQKQAKQKHDKNAAANQKKQKALAAKQNPKK